MDNQIRYFIQGKSFILQNYLQIKLWSKILWKPFFSIKTHGICIVQMK